MADTARKRKISVRLKSLLYSIKSSIGTNNGLQKHSDRCHAGRRCHGRGTDALPPAVQITSPNSHCLLFLTRLAYYCFPIFLSNVKCNFHVWMVWIFGFGFIYWIMLFLHLPNICLKSKMQLLWHNGLTRAIFNCQGLQPQTNLGKYF